MRVVLALLLGCGGSEPKADSPPDMFVRSCAQSLTYTTVNRPPCKWEWTCNDFSGPEPQYVIDCVAGAGADVTCQCREAGAITGSVTIANGCDTTAAACDAANARCGFGIRITCN